MKLSAYKDPVELRLRRLRALMYVFAKTNRILMGRHVTCQLVHEGSLPFPAWTVGTKISFNDPQLGPLDTAEDIVRVTGLDYHELGHASFTPNVQKGSDEFSLWLRSLRGVGQQAYNILEDQRTESMLVALFPSMRHYLTATFVEFIMGRSAMDASGNPQPADHGSTFLLSHGRRYLGSDIRDAIRGMFVGDAELADKIADVIDRYRVLNLNKPADRTIAKVLIERWLDLVSRLPQQAQASVATYEHATCQHGASGTPNTEETTKQAAKANAGVKQGRDDRDNMESNSGGQSGDDDDDAEDDDASKDWRSDASKDEGDEAGEPGGDGAGSTGGESTSHGSKELDTAIAAALNEILRDKDVAADVRNVQNAVNVVDQPEQITRKISFESQPNAEGVLAARAMGRRLQQIVEMQDPGWERRTSSGRMNIQRAITGRTDLDEMYDQWDPGNSDAASIEAVIIVDHSGSMQGHGTELSQAAWAMKASFDSINAPCSIYAYESNTRVVYQAHDRAAAGRVPKIVPMGGTEASIAVQEAARRLGASKRKKRLFLAMTDGQWYDGGLSQSFSSDEYIDAMNKAGIVTAMAYYPTGRAVDWYIANPDRVESHGCQVVRVVKDMPGLVDLTNAFISELLKRR
jgi:hypothetical protein